MKRETGANPVRTRHCNKGAENISLNVLFLEKKITGKPGRLLEALIFKSGDLPYESVQDNHLRPRVIGSTCKE